VCARARERRRVNSSIVGTNDTELSLNAVSIYRELIRETFDQSPSEQ